MELESPAQTQSLPSCRDLVREVDELREKEVYNSKNIPQSQLALSLPFKGNETFREPLRGISNTDIQFDFGNIYSYTKSTAHLLHTPPLDPTVSTSRGGIYFGTSETNTSAFRIPTNIPYDRNNARGESSETNSTSLVLAGSSSDWYNDSQTLIPSPPFALSLNDLHNSKARITDDRSAECGWGEACLWAAQKALLKQYSSCSFAKFGSHSPALLFSRQRSSSPSSMSSSASTSALLSAPKLVGNVYTEALHSPASGKYHFCLEIRSPAIEFHMPSACTRTRGVAVTDILKFNGQCIVDPGATVTPKLTKGGPQRTSIDLIIEWKGHSREVVPIPIRCPCGHKIKKGQIALEIARAHSKYFATQRCEDTYCKSTDIITGIENLRLMSLHTTDNGATWRAQHAIVEDVMYNAVEYLTQDGERRSGVVARSRREPISNFIAWVREGVEV